MVCRERTVLHDEGIRTIDEQIACTFVGFQVLVEECLLILAHVAKYFEQFCHLSFIFSILLNRSVNLVLQFAQTGRGGSQSSHVGSGTQFAQYLVVLVNQTLLCNHIQIECLILFSILLTHGVEVGLVKQRHVTHLETVSAIHQLFNLQSVVLVGSRRSGRKVEVSGSNVGCGQLVGTHVYLFINYHPSFGIACGSLIALEVTSIKLP